MENLIFDTVSKKYKDGDKKITVINEVDFKLKRGKLVGIVGPSGSGKSTFLSMAGALLTPSEGSISINGTNTSNLSQEELTQLRQETIGFIFQGSQLISYLTVLEQLTVINQLSNQSSKQADNFAVSLLEDLDLKHRLHAYPEELSGGEKQRVAIGRAFMNDPSIILADEPTASLDYERGYQIVEMIRDEVHKRYKEGLIVTHDTRLLELMDEVYLLKDGTLTKY